MKKLHLVKPWHLRAIRLRLEYDEQHLAVPASAPEDHDSEKAGSRHDIGRSCFRAFPPPGVVDNFQTSSIR